ncbi:cytochrome c oxidase subunit 1 [Basidiobolus ranarum]|uniref:Cytochrome c oxidase subunit 1 n=1 Tax=Basidiobolus ranarum TaxID=34480 RepID=A0ABR2WD07_9FUNG
MNRDIMAPIVPAYRHCGDTSNFDKYPEPEAELNEPNYEDPYSHLFQDFHI